MAEKAFENNNKTVSPNHQVLGGKKPKINADVRYADAPAVKPDESKSLEDAREKFAPNADKPTSASADKGQTDLPQLMKQIDPQGKAQVLPQMYPQLMQMSNILGMGSGMMGSSGSQNTPQNVLQNTNPIPSGISVVINDSFTGALALLSIKYGFERVIQVFTSLLDNGGIDQIDSRFQDIVKNSIANLIKVALYYGPLNIPVSVYDETIYGDIVPDPVVSDNNVPDGYIKQYYTISQDPYPGYIEWLSQDKSKKVYTKRAPGSYVYTSPNEETYSKSEIEIANDLKPYIWVQTPQPILTTQILNEILAKQVVNVENSITNNNIGNNASQNNNMGGQLQSLMQMLLSQQLPNSVLNQSEIQNTMKQYSKDMSFNNQLFELGNQAIGSGSGGALGSLNNMGGASNIMSGFNSGGGGISGVLGNLGGGNLLGSFGGFGGGSGGGGGGAGSGFPGASGGGYYSGGDVTETGKKNISQMLKLLGIS